MNHFFITLAIASLVLTSCTTNTNNSLVSSSPSPIKGPVAWQTYSNQKLGFSLEYPLFTLDFHNKNVCSVPVKVTETNSKIIFAQAYRTEGVNCTKIVSPQSEDVDLKTISQVGQFIINYAHATSPQEIEAFVKKLFGSGCVLSEETEQTETKFAVYGIKLDKKYDDTDFDQAATLCSAGFGGKYRFYYHRKTKTALLYQFAEKIFQDPYVYLIDTQPISETNFDTNEKLFSSFKYIDAIN